MLLHIEIDGLPPTVNHMYRMHGRYKYKTSDTREYQAHVTGKIRSEWQNKPVFKGRASLVITFYTNNRKRWDIDNRVKALQDCLNMAGVIGDDTQIDMLIVSRKHVQDPDHTSLTLSEVTE